MAGDDHLSDPIGPPDPTVFAVGLTVGVVTLLGLVGALVLVLSTFDDLLRPIS